MDSDESTSESGTDDRERPRPTIFDCAKHAAATALLSSTGVGFLVYVIHNWRMRRQQQANEDAFERGRVGEEDTSGNQDNNTSVNRRRYHQETQTSVAIIRKNDYGSLMETFIPDDEDWIEFGTKYLMLDEQDLSRVKRRFRGEQLKKEILQIWIRKYGVEATVSKAYDLAHKFRNDELEEVFRFLAKLVLDAREWKKFAKHGLGLERSVYKEHEDEISNEQKLRMLRQWRQRGGNDASVDELCIAVRTHFEGNPMLVNFCKAVMNPLYESQKAISGGMQKLCEAVKGMSMGKVHVQNSGTWNCRDPFIGNQGTNIDY